MIRWVAMSVALMMAALSAYGYARERHPAAVGAKQALSTQTAVGASRACRDIISSEPAVDIANAQARLREVARTTPAAVGPAVRAFDELLGCALARNPTDGGIFALMAWTGWRLGAPKERLSQLILQSYRLHPFETNSAAVRQLIIAAKWDDFGEDIQDIGRADQSLRFATDLPHHVVPEVAKLYLEAGTSSDLYHEALDRISRTAPHLLLDFEAVASGRQKPQ